ncbi:family 16 glycosylhydrolase [Flavicella sediminum]|uniref:family 16 glycosylhydrolase n=1 Tax=Flavicella sediminum TaxID=2585141 RepID=UPI001123F8BA|nr:family 16 glycosylhydrolase [Flavicella sediminum]
MIKKILFYQLALLAILFSNCQKEDTVIDETPIIENPKEDPKEEEEPDTRYPLSDQENTGNWILNTEVSDEFDAQVLDEDKWLIQGKGGVFQSRFVGRAPSQFSTENVRLEDGKLKLETRWEPDYKFIPRINNGKMYDVNGKDTVYFENITTAAIITKKEFLYGYLEIKSKAADAEVTSSFWATGGNTEFDFFEMFGDHRQTNKAWRDNELWWSLHDWSSNGNGGKHTYTEHHDLGFRVADAFHVYGYDWSANGIKIFIDGVLYRDVPRTEINAYDDITHGGGNGDFENYVVTKAIKIWLDQETFPWHGVPDSKDDLEFNSPENEKEDGIIDFEVEYVRVWQKQ